MKRYLLVAVLVVTAAVFMVACNRQPQTAGQSVIFADTTGLAEFQQWKAMNERLDPNMYYGNQPVAAPQRTAARQTTARRSSNSGTMNTSTSNTAKKKGWSKAAKGAVIGGASGAVLGAVIHKRNRVVGGVVGGILGGGVGYGIGRSQDKKDGRYYIIFVGRKQSIKQIASICWQFFFTWMLRHR
jgi:hypothetical protein